MHTQPEPDPYIYLLKKLKTLTINTKYSNPNHSLSQPSPSPSPFSSLPLLLVTCYRHPPPSHRCWLLRSSPRRSLPHCAATPPPYHRHRSFLFASLIAPPLHLATVTDPYSLPPSPHLQWKKGGIFVGFSKCVVVLFWSFGGAEVVVAFRL